MKKNNLLITFILSGLFTLIINGCKKYDEGGVISKTEKNLNQTWVLHKYLRNGIDETSLLYVKNYEETYSDSETYSRTYIDKESENVTETGIWVFDKDQKKLNLSGIGSIDISDETGTISSSTYNILKLDKSEFWYYYTNGSDKHEFHLIKKK